MTSRYQSILASETAHLVGEDRAKITAMLADAQAFAQACANATPEAITLKLLTLHEGAERWVRQLVARAALEAVTLSAAA